MFFGRSRNTPTAQQLTRGSGAEAASQNPLHNAFRHTENTAQRLNVVEELFSIKVNQPLEKDVSNEVNTQTCNIRFMFDALHLLPDIQVYSNRHKARGFREMHVLCVPERHVTVFAVIYI